VDYSPNDIICKSNMPQWDGPYTQLEEAEHLGFRPHFGWVGHVERGQTEQRLEGKRGL